MKRVMCAVLTALLLSQGIPAAYAAEQTKPASSGVEVSAKSVILMERETGTVLYQQAEHEQREPASVTKIMTMLLVVEAIEQGQLHLGGYGHLFRLRRLHGRQSGLSGGGGADVRP